jgi:hypothetical protein
MTKENKIKERLNKFALELMNVRVGENTLIEKCITLMQNGESEKGSKLLSFDNTSEIINRLFDLAHNLRKDTWAMVEE